MPTKRGRSKAQNLGTFALKRKGDTVQQSDEDQPSKRSRNASPNGSSIHSDNQENPDPDSLNNLDLDSETDGEIEIQEENDVPHPRDHADLLQWLQLSDAQLDSLSTSTAPVHHGAYHSRKIGAKISERRGQELRKLDKERAAREEKADIKHGRKKTAITDFFSRPTFSGSQSQEPEQEPDSPSEERSTTDAEMDIEPESGLLPKESGSYAETAASLPNSDWSDSEIGGQGVNQAASSHASVIELSDSSGSDIVEEILGKSSTPRVTLEVVEDEDDGPLHIEPCELSPEARAEEGLDDLLWDPSEQISPYAAQRQLPEPAQTQPLQPGEATYLHHELGFIMPNCPQPQKIISQRNSESTGSSAPKARDWTWT
ncbi:hypothetical protein DFH08DRAFT_807405 [Mycena albidolilacea]|uniref:Uncharacterized protein n=1 Tax=Mycena albidolilacea TaxID=1033008 RepID=A0AAD7A5Y9_9AGAR|nr:hypothetical protein DFH08DRAFT_807405 [Mycena albidolilacea]